MNWEAFIYRLSRRGTTWVLYVVLASVVPFGFIAYVLHSEERLKGWSDVLSNGELIIVAVTISAGAVGDLLSTEKQKTFPLPAIVNVFIAFMNVFIGSLIYGLHARGVRSVELTDTQLENVTLASAIIFGLSCVVGVSTIVLTTWWQEEVAQLKGRS